MFDIIIPEKLEIVDFVKTCLELFNQSCVLNYCH